MAGSKAPSLRETLLRVRHENSVQQQAGKMPSHTIAPDPKYRRKGTPAISPESASLESHHLAAIPLSSPKRHVCSCWRARRAPWQRSGASLVLSAWRLELLFFFDPMPLAQSSDQWCAVEAAYNWLLQHPDRWRGLLRRYGKDRVKQRRAK